MRMPRSARPRRGCKRKHKPIESAFFGRASCFRADDILSAKSRVSPAARLMKVANKWGAGVPFDEISVKRLTAHRRWRGLAFMGREFGMCHLDLREFVCLQVARKRTPVTWQTPYWRFRTFDLLIHVGERFEVLVDGRAFDIVTLPVAQDIMRLPPFDGPLPLVTIRPEGADGTGQLPSSLAVLPALPQQLPPMNQELVMNMFRDQQGMMSLKMAGLMAMVKSGKTESSHLLSKSSPCSGGMGRRIISGGFPT